MMLDFQQSSQHESEESEEYRKHRDQFNPYIDNQGTVLAIAGKDFVVIGGDTRLSLGYSILSRNKSKIYKLTSTCALASSGMHADIKTLQKVMRAHITMYEFKFRKEPTTDAIAQLLSNTLYYKRFFPYYAFNLLCGINAEGEGVVYAYDAIGSFDKVTYGTVGSGMELVTPVLDLQFKGHNNPNPELPKDLNIIKDTIKDVMNSCTERDIHTGDQLEVVVITKDGIQTSEYYELRKD